MRLKATTPPFYLMLLALLFLGAFSISNKVFYPISSNMGLRTDYYMSFTPDQTYALPSMNIRFSIPLEYNLSQISNDMECYISETGVTNSYRKMPTADCFVQPNLNTTYSLAGDLIINVPALSSTIPLHFVFRNIDNPTVDSSSFFGLCVRSGTHLLQCDKQFKMLTFTSGFPTSAEGFSIETNPQRPVVGQGTTYYFKFRTNITKIAQAGGFDLNKEFVQVRVTFPKEYSSSNAICSMMQLSPITGTYSAIQVTTSSSPSKSYSIECKRMQNFMSAYLFNKSSTVLQDLYLKIQNIQNPIYSGAYVNQLYIDISRGGRNQIVQRIRFNKVIDIFPEDLLVSVDQSNMMRNATNQYFFYLTHDLNYGDNSKIRLTIGNNAQWNVHDVKLMFGFTKNLNFTSTITNGATSSVIEISNYGIASKQEQQIIAVNLTSATVIGDHLVKVETIIDGRISGTWTSVVKLNATWGAFNRLSFSAVQQPIKLPVGKTGPLEFTLFLNYELPESQNIENGSIIIQFTPPIRKPNPDIYGKVKCYFKATMQAAQCDYDDSDPLKTKIRIVSPPYDQFQYSEIPIIITTEGGIDDQHLGLTISSVVERYKFQVDFFLYNSSVIPSEVLYTNWLADAIQLQGALTGNSLTYQADQLTALHFNLKTPLMTTPENRLLFLFNPDINGRNAWDSTLGYQADRIYKEFPCVVLGLPGNRIKCDLYTYVDALGPYNKLHIRSKLLGPFFMVYGFTNPVPQGIDIQVYLPGIKTSTNVGADAMVSFSILQETPGDTQPYIELYHQDVKIFTLQNAPNVALLTSPAITVTPQVTVQTPRPYTMTWSVVSAASVAYIKFDFTNQLPSMETKFDICSLAASCYSSGFPNNWMVQTRVPGTVTTPYTFTSTLNVLTMPHISTLVKTHPVKITTYSIDGRTLQIIDMNHEYIPKPMTGGFNLLDSSLNLYSGLKQWYQITFTAAIASTSAYPFIHLKLNPDLKFASPQQCESISILPFNETGIKCRILPNTGDRELIVSNIKSINSGLAYQLRVRLQTTLADHTAPIYPAVDILVNHNNSIVSSLVETAYLVPLAATNTPTPVMSRPDEFTISNPQILNEEVRINYIGRLFVDFDSSAAVTTNFRVAFPNHRYNTGKWSTANEAVGVANSSLNDPLVCLINNVRFYCSQTYNPLVITINSAILKTGRNRLQLDTEYVVPFNGIYFPIVAGNYEIHFSTYDVTTALWNLQHTAYIYIRPPSLEDIEIASIVKDVGTESVYLLNFTIADAIAIPTANHATGNWSRIFIEFPTIVNGVRVFKDKLGDIYQGLLNERVGCAFLKGLQYVVAETTVPPSRLECRLIPPEIPGAPVKIQVINFDAFSATVDSMGLFIFGVDNPGSDTNAVNSFEIKVKINNYHTSGKVYPLFESDFVVFLDPRTKLPFAIENVPVPSTQSPITNFFNMALDVGDPGKIQMKAQTITPGAALPFYMLVKLPPYLPVPYDTITVPAFVSCPLSNFEYCVTAPDVNYVLVKARVNPSFFEVKINDYPLGISQQDSKFYSMIIESGRYKGNIEYIISKEKRWLDIRGDIVFNYIQPVGSIEKSNIQKQRFHVAIKFTTTNYIPATGSIAIVFPTSVTKIYPYCRSDTSNLTSLLKTVSGTSGEIGCAVQNGNQWVITGFAPVLANTAITISGYIDLPTISGSLGLGEIITYADNHPDNIYLNGSQIDYVKPFFNLMVQNVLAMNPNEDIFLSQRDVVRAGDVGEFRLLMKLPLVLTTTGTITLDFSKNDFNGKPGGFQLFATPKKVCEMIDITTEYRVGCQVLTQQDLTSDGQSYIRYTMRVFEDLSTGTTSTTGTTYELRLTTNARYTGPDAPQGIKYPTVASTYKIQASVKYSAALPDTTTQNLYIDVYGPEFNSLKVTQHNYIQNQYNVYWFEVQPFTTITTKHQLVIEFPTKSNDGQNLFSNNLGLAEYRSGDEIAMDIFDSTNALLAALVPPQTPGNDFMKCHIHHGHQASGLPVKIVCGNFLKDIAITDWLRFAIGIINPIIPGGQVSIPLSIYSQDPYTFTRTNFNLVNGAGYIYDTSNILAKNGFPTTTSLQMQMPNDDFMIGNANTYALLPGDAFLVKFNFPIRKNGKVPTGCKNVGKTIIYGDAIYHERLRTVVCKIPLVTGISIPLQITPAAATLLFEGFYTPWYYLAPAEQKLIGIAHYYSTTSSEVVSYTDLFPLLPPRYQFPLYLSPATSVLTMTPVINHMIQCQRNDYVFTIQIDPAATGATNFNLQYTKLIGIVFPLSSAVDFMFYGRDCVEHASSDIEIKLCDINEISRTIFIEILPGIYSNDKKIVIQTKGLAIGNPCLVPTFDVTKLVVNFYSWQNITASDKRALNRVYMKLDFRNVPLPTLTQPIYTPETSNAAGGYFRPFDWVEIPNEKYYDEFHQFMGGQYSPFKFDIKLTTAIAAQTLGTNSYNTLTLYYGDKFDIPSPQDQYIDDLKYNTEYCFLRNTRVQRCENDFANKRITMYFEFDLPISEWINVYFSIQNPMDRQINGFKYIGSDSDIADGVYLELKQFGAASTYHFKVNPFEAKQTNFDPALTVLPERAIINGVIDYGNAMTSQLNVIDITLTVNNSVTDIKGLKFEIPLVDEFGAQIFDSPATSFIGLTDGEEYPCGNNDDLYAATGKAKCYLFMGSNANLGQPTTIIMTDFTYATRIKARFIFKNPSVAGKWVTIVVKAYKGANGPENSIIGHKYVGYWRFYNIFQTVAGTLAQSASTAASTTTIFPSNPTIAASIPDANYNNLNPLWMDSTTWKITGTPATGIAAAAGQYVIFEAFINKYDVSYTEPEFCQADWTTGNTMSDDMFYFKSRAAGNKFEKVFFIKKWVASPWLMQFFKCKHYLNDFIVYYHGSKIDQSVSYYNIPFASFLYTLYAPPSIKYFHVMSNRMEIEIDLTASIANAMSVRGLNWEENVNYAMVVTVDAAMPFTGISACFATGGFENTRGKSVTCEVVSTTSFTIKNFNKLITNHVGQYTIRIDAPVSIGTVTLAATTATVSIYAGLQAFNAGQYMYQAVSAAFTRAQPHYIGSSITAQTCGCGTTYLGLSQNIPPPYNSGTEATYITNYNNYYETPRFRVDVLKTKVDTNAMYLEVKMEPIGSAITMDSNFRPYFSFRFTLEGVNINCGSSMSVMGNSKHGIEAIPNRLADRDLTRGFKCIGPNNFYYSTYEHTAANSLFVGTTSACRQQFDDSFPLVGDVWELGEYIVFYITINTFSAVVEPSWTRDWIGLKAFLHTNYITRWSTSCCTGGCGTCCNTITCWCCDGTQLEWFRTQNYIGYGEGMDSSSPLFLGGVTLTALTEYINQETQLEVIMRNSYVPFDPAATAKLLLLEFDSGSTTLFPYINSTSTQFNYPIECNCLVSGQPDFSGASTYTNLECLMRYLPVPTIYAHTAISVNLVAPAGSYIKCYFPGFKPIAAINLKVTAKIVNKGINQAVHPLTGQTYGSIYRTTSATKSFTARPGTSPYSSVIITETPDLYNVPAPAPTFTILTAYNTFPAASYTLGFDFGGAVLAYPTFYINFQKGGPFPDDSLCTQPSNTFEFCRIYSKYRNIMVARYLSNAVLTGSFTSTSVTLPKAKEHELPGQYDMIVWVKNNVDNAYSWGQVKTRSDPTLLKPSTTVFSVMPDRITSNNYETFTSNLILSFKLQGHSLTEFWKGDAKIDIEFDNNAYFAANKGCIVSTDLINDDQKFPFYCEIDRDPLVKKIKIQNRKYDAPFSATGLIQVVVGVTNQAVTAPIKFTLKMYKWYNSATNYGLLILKDVTYTPFSINSPAQVLQLRNQIKMYPFYTRFYSDVHAPFRMAFKLAPTVTAPLSYANNLNTFMFLDDFDGITDFPSMPFECYIKQFPNPATNLLLPHTNGYRNYKQNTMYYFIPTYCTYVIAAPTALRIEIPRNRDLDNTKYYELVVMPVASTRTGFKNLADPVAKLNIFPLMTAGHYFDIKVWKKAAFSLSSLWFVTTRPLEPNAIQFTFTTNFILPGVQPVTTAFPDNYIEVVFNNLPLSALPPIFSAVGATVPCSLSSAFTEIPLATRTLRPNCIVTYLDKLHQVIKIRIQNFQMTGPATFQLSFDDFQLPEINNLLQLSNTFSVCMAYWSAGSSHERCFGEIFVIDRYINLVPRVDSTTIAAFLPMSELKYGAPSSPTLQFSYPFTSTTQRNQKVMIRIAGGYSANNPAPLSFTGSTMLWHNPMIGLYIQRLSTVTASTTHQIVISGVINPHPYQMQQYMAGCTLQLTYFQGYYPKNKYTMPQPPYPNFIMNMPLVKLGSAYFDDIKTSVKAETESIIKLNVEIIQNYAKLELHENDRFEIEFATNVVKVKRCWVVTDGLNIEYSKVSTCTPKPFDPKRLQLLNFWKSRTDNTHISNLVVYAVIEASDTTVSIKSHLYARNDQKEFQSQLVASIMSVSIPMMPFTEMTFTENHYMPGYFEQIITPVTHLSTVEMMYLSFFLPEKLFAVNSVFTIFLNATGTIKPTFIAATGDTRLICEWMRVSKYGRQYNTGKFSHCVFRAPNIIINAPTWHLEMNDAAGARIPYLLKIREESPTASTFVYPTTSQVQQIILQSDTGGIFKKDTLRVRPYKQFVGLTTKHTTLTINQLNTYTISYTGPVTVSAGAQFVLTLEIDAKSYLPDTMGIKEIYDLYGENPKNTSIIDNTLHNMLYTSLPNKWINGIPYSGWTSLGHSNLLNTIEKSDKTIRINLLLPAYAAPTAIPPAIPTPMFIWKIPLLKNPATEKPLRMNVTLWSYPATHTQGHKQLFYEIINEHITKVPAVTIPSITYDITAAAQAANVIQRVTGSLNVQFPTYTPIVGDVVQAKLLARAVGFKKIPTFWTPSFIDTTYQFYFFKEINFVIAEKISPITPQNWINFGSIQETNEYSDEYGFEWVKIHSATNMETTKIGGQVKRNIRACQVPAVTYQRMSGMDNIVNGKFEAEFTFTTPCRVPKNSTLKLVVASADLDFLPNGDEAYCETTFRSKNCWLDSSKILYVRIDEALAASTVMSVTTFAKSKTRAIMKQISGEIYAIPDKPLTLVNTLPSTAVLPITTATTLNNAAMFPLLIKPLYQRVYDLNPLTYYTKLVGTFTSRHPLTTFAWMNLLSPFVQLATSNQTFHYRRNNSGSPYGITQNNFNYNWMRSRSVMTTSQDSTQHIQSNMPDGINSYDIIPGQQYLFSIGSMYETTDKNNYLVKPVGSYYQFEYRTDEEIAYHEVYPVPIAQKVTVINPLPQIGQQTVLGIEFACSRQEIRPLDKIEIQLDSHNLIEDMYKFTNDKLECIEFVKGVLTGPTQDLVCEVAQYPDAATKKSMLIHVFPTLPVAINAPVKIWISPIVNSPNVLVAGVTVRLLRYCSGEKLCTLYEGRGWYKTINMASVVNYGTTGATFTPSSTMVLETMKDHVYTFNSIALYSSLIKYPENYQDVMPLICTRTGGSCLVFPRQRKVVTIEGNVALTTLKLSGMTNGIYIQPVDKIDMKLASLTNLAKYQIIHPLLVERNYMPVIGAAALNTFDIVNTQNSNNIFLRNYWNTVRITITGLFSTAFVKAFYIVTPPQVTDWQTDYCNATISAASHLPYPQRLECKQITINTIQILIPEGVNYVASVSETQVLTIHAKFWLVDFPPGEGILYVSQPMTSGLFNAYGSFRADSFASQYRITRVTKTIQISQHKTPLISQVAFNTESFEERLASINDPTTFDILIDPYSDITNNATNKVDFIEVIIPEEFMYPNVLMHDMCQLIFRRVTDLTVCRQTRKDNQTIITIDIDQSIYDNGPRILRIASRNRENWFTAPSIPGILYNMTISLYGTNGQLLEKQSTKNSSRIKGYDLKLPQIVVENGHDQLQQQIYDIEFKVGPVGIKQGYRGILALGEYYSEIKVKFETVQGYEYLLGGYYKHGDRVGCVTNLKSINREIACIFSMGTNITHQPAIIISNYEQIIPDNVNPVRLSFANIKNLPASLRNTLSIEVKYYRVGDTTEDQKYSYMMYQPTQAITDVTSLLAAVVPAELTVSYPGQTIVNEPTTFQVDLKPTTDLGPNDYIVVKFPKNGLRDQYSRFNVTCGVCVDCSINCKQVQIFYRAQVIRIYPKDLDPDDPLVNHPANTPVSYILKGFPSTEYIVDNPIYPITVEVYKDFKIVNKDTKLINLKMQGCKLSSGIIQSTSPYIGDAGVIYTFEAQVNVSQLSRSDEPKQLNLMIKLPEGSAWFSSQSSCQVELPLYCSIDDVQKRIVVKNLLSYTKSTVSIKTFNVINPSALTTLTTLNFSSSLYEETTVSNIVTENTICVGAFGFTYMPSPPNQCALSLKSQHLSTTKQNILTFGIVCEKAIRNSTSLYFMVPRDITFNNPMSQIYKCWTSNPSILLDNRCQIVFINGTFYVKTMGSLDIGSNLLDFQLSIVANNPLVAGDYVFGAALEHAGNFYSITNNATLTFYQTPVAPQLNTSISIQVVPQQASAEAIYVVKMPTQMLNDKLSLNFGNFGVQLTADTKISYYQPTVNATASSTDTTNWVGQQSYFSLLQQTYTNTLSFSTTKMADLSQDIMISTDTVPRSVDGWTYIILSPITNPSSSSATDSLKMKIIDRITTNTSTYDTLVNQLDISMNLNIESPPSNIYQTQYSVIDNDILSSTKHTVTFKLDRKLFANQDGRQNLEIIIDPPTNSMASIKVVQTCLYYPDINKLVECKLADIGTQELSFKPIKTNLTFLPQTPFIIEFKNITNPENETFCAPKVATEKDYLASYFEMKIFIDKKLEYQSVFVGMLDDSIKPCVEFKTKKGDILHNLPAILNAGFETQFNISITQPTASLRVFLSTNDTDLVFSQSVIYFNAYDKMFISLRAIVSSNAVNKTVEVYLKREQTSAFNAFREPQSFLVKLVAGQKQTVAVYEMQSSSVGYDIKIPITLSKPSVNNMTLLLTVENSTIMQPYLKFFTFSTYQVAIPALSNSSSFTVKYNGTQIPPTFSIRMRLISQNNPTHELLKDVIYLYFAIDPKYQTLPPIMRMNLLWLYKSNNDLMSKTIYYCCAPDNQTTTLANNTMMLPVIIETKVLLVTATKTDIQVSTRSEATLFYQLREKGKHFELVNITSKALRTHNLSQSTQTIRNSTKIVNANQVLNFTNLQHQTEYFLYVSAFDAFGDSENVTVLQIKTSQLSKAIKFNLNCFEIEKDEVKIVRALADILKIDMRRIRVVSSEQNLAKTFSVSQENKPIYAHEIVISPSLTDDSMSPEDLFKTRLMGSLQNQGFLKEKIPSWTGNFDPISQFQDKKSFYEIPRVQPTFKQPPVALKISYYNASIGVKLWAKARISAVIIVQESQTPDDGVEFVNKKPKGRKVSSLDGTEKQLSPNSKQIIKGLNQFNQKLATKYTYSGISNQQGQGVVFFKGLKPGSYCKVFITAQNPQDFEPTTALADSQVYMIDFNLMWNPNLKGNNHLALNELKKKNEKMYNVIKEFYENQDNANKKSGTTTSAIKKA